MMTDILSGTISLSGQRFHKVDFNLRGTVVPVDDYRSGDAIVYGGMIYRPAQTWQIGDKDFPSNFLNFFSGAITSGAKAIKAKMEHRNGDYWVSGGTVWGESYGDKVHEAWVTYPGVFYCS
jgi:hypothetical protein